MSTKRINQLSNTTLDLNKFIVVDSEGVEGQTGKVSLSVFKDFVKPNLSNLATLTYVNSELSKKASTDYVDNAVTNLASKTYVNNKVSDLASEQYVNDSVSNLATITYVDNQIEGLASEQYVDNLMGDFVTTTYVNNYVDNQISGLASTSFVAENYTTKLYVDTQNLNLQTNLQDQIDDKASITYVNDEIANLVGSSPEALNTLNELATALGDDPNFATTINNEIATKASITYVDNAVEFLANEDWVLDTIAANINGLATEQYVDTSVADLTTIVSDNYLPLTGGTLTGNINFLESTSIGIPSNKYIRIGGTEPNEVQFLVVREEAGGPGRMVFRYGDGGVRFENVMGGNTGLKAQIDQSGNFNINGNLTTVNPSADYHAATKLYVDNAVSNVDVSDELANYLPLSGGTVSGSLNVSGQLHVGADSAFTIKVNSNGDADMANSTGDISPHFKNYFRVYKGNIGSGSLVFEMNETTIKHNNKQLAYTDDLTNLATTSYVDTNYLPKSGGTMNGELHMFNNIISFTNSNLDGTDDNIDHIWYDDVNNSYHFVADASFKDTGNAKMYAGRYYRTDGTEVFSELEAINYELANNYITEDFYSSSQNNLITNLTGYIDDEITSVNTKFVEKSGGTFSGKVTINNDLDVNYNMNIDSVLRMGGLGALWAVSGNKLNIGFGFDTIDFQAGIKDYQHTFNNSSIITYTQNGEVDTQIESIDGEIDATEPDSLDRILAESWSSKTKNRFGVTGQYSYYFDGSDYYKYECITNDTWIRFKAI